MLSVILEQYGIEEKDCIIESFGSGLINHTWRILHRNNEYILQKINDSIFKTPWNIDNNIQLMEEHLLKNHPGYFFVAPVKTINEEGMVQNEQGYFRMFPFVKNSVCKTVLQTPGEAYEAAAQFGKFTNLLSGIEIEKIKITLPQFHDLPLRQQQFENALQNGNAERIKECAEWINALKNYSGITEEYKKIISSPDFKLRVTHHDTKISNVLFDEKGKGLCVIDLDTVMPGYFISDVGDMMRTYLCPVSEEEKDFSKIEVRNDFYKAIVDGYSGEMKNELTATEKQYFFYAGKFIIYMQALRFLTDYLNNDVYYGSKYPTHNLVRAGNQITLLQRLLEKEGALKG